jgi:hypothetical protein
MQADRAAERKNRDKPTGSAKHFYEASNRAT